MIRKDYILRLIEQFGVLWARLLTQLRSGLLHDARATLDLAYQQLLGLDGDMVRARSSGELLARLRFGAEPEVGHERSAMLSALLAADGERAVGQGQPDLGATFYQKALDIALALRIGQPDAPLPDYAPEVERLVDALRDYDLPFDTNRLLLQYYKLRGAFAKAEDALFDLLGQAPGSPNVAALGEGFYDRLERRSDAELRAGDFSRDEIAAGREELRRIARRHT
jgi:hypothetical protein